MKITADDIRNMVNECVKSILNERRGAIDDSMRGLAVEIISRIHSGEAYFHIDFDELSKYVPERYLYKNGEVRPKWSEGFNVEVFDKQELKGTKMAWCDKKNTLEINAKYQNTSDIELMEYLMHEFTHMVNYKCATKPMRMISPASFYSKTAHRIFYYFNPSEMQARLTQFKIWLETNPQNSFEGALFNADDILNISFMETIIPWLNEITINDENRYVVDILSASKIFTLHIRNGKSNNNYENGIPDKEFEKAKDSLVKTYENRYISYINKARKIYNDSQV